MNLIFSLNYNAPSGWWAGAKCKHLIIVVGVAKIFSSEPQKKKIAGIYS